MEAENAMHGRERKMIGILSRCQISWREQWDGDVSDLRYCENDAESSEDMHTVTSIGLTSLVQS